jgi:hypothetical protein
MDNTLPHNSRRAQKHIKASRSESLSHPACSPDVALSNFFLFEYIKGKLSDYICESREYLVNAITEISIGVNQEVLLNVFESWVNQLK